jgi:DUF1680 family protein
VVLSALGVPAGAEKIADRAAPLRPGQVRLTGWLGGRIDANVTNRLATINLEERLRPFRSPTEKEGWSGEHIGKWLHAASLACDYRNDPNLRRKLAEAAQSLAASQGADGYLGTYGPEHRWGGWDVWTHKYNLLGLLAYYDLSKDPQALATARKIGDLLVATFGDGKRDILRSGTHVGMAATSVLEPIVLLHRATGDPRYLQFARYIVRAYDQPNGPKIVATLTATHSVAKTANRKAYEMMSNLVGLCELYRETGDETFLKVPAFAHDDIVANQMYLTGGTSLGEHFQDPHQLPNVGAVSENCAHVTWLQLCIALLRLTGEPKYADTIERIVYNHLLASQKPSGESLCYFTPLAGKKPYDKGMNCCTSSGPRGIALVPTIVYTLGRDSLAVNLYEPSTAEMTVSGTQVRVEQRTRYPLDGRIELILAPERPAAFDLLLRIPGWCGLAGVWVNDELLTSSERGGKYFKISRQWNKGDRVVLAPAMPATLVRGSFSNEGLVAIQRGPLVLACDAALNPGVSLYLVTPIARDGGLVPLALKASAEIGKLRFEHLLQGEGETITHHEGHRIEWDRVPLVWTSFADAGQSGSSFAVRLPSPERLTKIGVSPFLLAKESYSRQGNVNGSIADGDPATWRVTYDGNRHAEDWFAAEAARPVTINSVTYCHGRIYHDGGWWDATQGKPRIQIKKDPNGPWEDAARLDDYPATTATDSKNLAPGQRFTARIAPVKAVAIRVIGAPACGDRPEQNFASCAELSAAMQSGQP